MRDPDNFLKDGIFCPEILAIMTGAFHRVWIAAGVAYCGETSVDGARADLAKAVIGACEADLADPVQLGCLAMERLSARATT